MMHQLAATILTPQTSVTFMLIQTLGLLAVIALAALVIVKFWGPRLNAAKLGRELKVLERCALSHKQELILVALNDTRLLLGAGEGGLKVLHRDQRAHQDDAPLGAE